MSFDIAVTKQLGSATLSYSFRAGSGITALFGPSGAGKTSLLNMVAGLLRPDSGRITVDGAPLFDSATRLDLPPERRRAGYVFQEARLFPHRSVLANLRYGMRFARPEHRWLGLREAIDFLDVGHLLGRSPSTLSGGEAQRVSIGRALLSGPRFLLMDEPLSSLDGRRAEEVQRVIERIRDELALPILYVTHAAPEIERLATTIIHLPQR
jgi:molybdate transport system ATP-binding protein